MAPRTASSVEREVEAGGGGDEDAVARDHGGAIELEAEDGPLEAEELEAEAAERGRADQGDVVIAAHVANVAARVDTDAARGAQPERRVDVVLGACEQVDVGVGLGGAHGGRLVERGRG